MIFFYHYFTNLNTVSLALHAKPVSSDGGSIALTMRSLAAVQAARVGRIRGLEKSSWHFLGEKRGREKHLQVAPCLSQTGKLAWLA